jgi:hypothetical protein
VVGHAYLMYLKIVKIGRMAPIIMVDAFDGI